MTTSQNGWPLSPPRSSRQVPGTNVYLTVADGPAGDLLMYVAEQFHKRVERLDETADDWGYSYRANTNNPSVWSNHASATAIDLNATRHPNGKGGTFTKAQYAEIDRILAEVDNRVAHLRGYDEMHFEIRGTKAQVEAAARKIKGGGPTTAPKPSFPTLKRGSTGPEVERIQRVLNVSPADGIFGPVTESAVKSFQRASGIADDGIVGPVTWEYIIARESGGNSGSSGSGGTAGTSRPTLRRGSTGKEVADLQAFLNRVFPRYSSLAVDGAFGERTEAVVKEFQRRSGLEPDGIVGPLTWRALGFR